MDLLRLSTAGSVDDGKSTLIGRLLYESKSVFEDQLLAVEKATKMGAGGEVDLSLLTDGLRAEREQGITIDVAYRYFATPKRKFIIADTPGHEQYTRNMATGASTAQASIILIDARNGVQVQSRRHAYIAHLLGIPHLVAAVNKMDLVDYDQEVFEGISREFREFQAKLGRTDVAILPISALKGDNITTQAKETMPWYDGPSMLDYLENIDISSDENFEDLRFPVQMVIRPDLDFRAFAGELSSGVVKTGDKITVLPSNKTSTVKTIHTAEGIKDLAFPPMSISLQLEDEIDISRGDMIVGNDNLPMIERTVLANLVWMSEAPLQVGRPYLIKHTTRQVRCRIDELINRIDVNSLDHQDSESLTLNEIGNVSITCSEPLYFDSYQDSRRTGSFILIDLQTYNTVAAGMLTGSRRTEDTSEPWSGCEVSREARESINRHKAAVIWLTGEPGVGKRELARAVELRLLREGIITYRLDCDDLRTTLSSDVTPGSSGDSEHLRRTAEVCNILTDAGHIVIASIDSPTDQQITQAQEINGHEDFLSVLVGSSDSLETHVDLSLPLHQIDKDQAVERLVSALSDRGILSPEAI